MVRTRDLRVAILQLTMLRGELSSFVQISTIDNMSFSLFISKASISYNGGVPFPINTST